MAETILRIYRANRSWILWALISVYLIQLSLMCWHYLVGGQDWWRVEPLALASLVLAGVMVFAALGRRLLLPAVWFIAGGFVAEVIGVNTGLIFGSYRYQGFGVQLLGVPLLIPLAWALLLVYISQSLAGFRLRRLPRALAGAAWMTLFDLVIDPLASGPPGCWHWLEAGSFYGVPLSNFLSWFMVSFVLLYFAPPLLRTSRIVEAIGITVACCALLAAISIGYPVVALGAVSLLILHAALKYCRTNRPSTGQAGAG